MNIGKILHGLIDLGMPKKQAHIFFIPVIRLGMDLASFKNQENPVEILKNSIISEIESYKNIGIVIYEN